MATKNFMLTLIMSLFVMTNVQASTATGSNETVTAETSCPASSENESVSPCYEQATGSSLLVNSTTTEIVKANTTDVYTRYFYAGETAFVYVNGDGDTDLDLYVYDENGNLVDSDTDSGDTCLCTFTPKWYGKFKIKVKNLGSVYNKYTIRLVQ